MIVYQWTWTQFIQWDLSLERNSFPWGYEMNRMVAWDIRWPCCSTLGVADCMFAPWKICMLGNLSPVKWWYLEMGLGELIRSWRRNSHKGLIPLSEEKDHPAQPLSLFLLVSGYHLRKHWKAPVCSVVQLCPALRNPVDCGPPTSFFFVHGLS